ncbi:hypothetical protein AVEN_262084-1 [Araneus ventricosus]|uniref:Uncharacterized protein n=1 Tax=Araneus ventricosus TaxID=182803 RepID=A0A4Y2S588_ARAVE|nr:hypothetical protein AVEN_262084-1 [Araneus ventricosus]
MGRREDGQNLIDAWLEDKKTRRLKARYVSNKREFDQVDPKSTDYLLVKLRLNVTIRIKAVTDNRIDG